MIAPPSRTTRVHDFNLRIGELSPAAMEVLATTDAPTDVGNLILYQGALASYAKRDEQVRTLGNLVTKLLG